MGPLYRIPTAAATAVDFAATATTAAKKCSTKSQRQRLTMGAVGLIGLGSFIFMQVTIVPTQRLSSQAGDVPVVATQTNRLRYDWTRLERLSPLARQFAAHQSNCALPFHKFQMPGSGLGSNLHYHSQYLCNALEQGQYRIRTVFPWTWLDLEGCAAFENVTVDDYATGTVVVETTTATTLDKNETVATNPSRTTVFTRSSMSCFFPEAEPSCPQDYTMTAEQDSMVSGEFGGDPTCAMAVVQDNTLKPMVRASATEYYFTRISPMIQTEAERLLTVTFPPDGRVPPNLITIHMRWGDKGGEMPLQGADVYVQAVRTILEQRKDQYREQQNRRKHSSWSTTKKYPIVDSVYWNASYEEVNIYLGTEDINALNAFREAAPPAWNIFVDDFFPAAGSTSIMSVPTESKKAGLVTLALLLLSMEANTFVLTTASNWSRLINELRKNVLDPRCGDCTMHLDLVGDEWR